MNAVIIEITQKILACLGYPNEEINVVRDDEVGLVKFIVSFDEARILIGRGGEGLRSLNYVIRKMLEQKEGADTIPNFVIDVNDYYGKKINELKTKAKIVADRAISFKRNIELEPMSAYDRLMVHAYLTNFSHIKTESTGEGMNRHVVVQYVE